MSQPDESHGCPYCGDEHPARIVCRTTDPQPLSREDLLRAAWLLSPAARPATTAGGSAEVETPGPAITQRQPGLTGKKEKEMPELVCVAAHPHGIVYRLEKSITGAPLCPWCDYRALLGRHANHTTHGHFVDPFFTQEDWREEKARRATQERDCCTCREVVAETAI